MGEKKRIKDLTTASSITNSDYLAMDNSSKTAATKTSAMPLKNVQGSDDAYSTTKAYSVGDLAIRNNQLYRCKTACSAGSWATNSGYFDAVTLTDAVNDLNSAFMQCNTAITNIQAKIPSIKDSTLFNTNSYGLKGALRTYGKMNSVVIYGVLTQNVQANSFYPLFPLNTLQALDNYLVSIEFNTFVPIRFYNNNINWGISIKEAIPAGSNFKVAFYCIY